MFVRYLDQLGDQIAGLGLDPGQIPATPDDPGLPGPAGPERPGPGGPARCAK